jgi:putative ABC transport system substrate-binding protein
MRRREFIMLLGGAAVVAPVAAHAQQKAMPVIGYLSIGSPSVTGPAIAAFRQGVSDIGHIDGQSLVIESRYAEGRYDRLSALVAELIDRNVDVILATGGSIAALAAKRATSTIPIVFIEGDDPVIAGVVASFARPGGNIYRRELPHRRPATETARAASHTGSRGACRRVPRELEQPEFGAR